MTLLKNMGKFSRSKGKRGELELVHGLQELGFREVHRSQQYRGAAESADVIGVPGIHIEAKRCERFSIYAAYEQAVHDSEGAEDIPTVFHRRNGKPWLVVMSLEDWARLYRDCMNCSETE